MSVYFIKIGRYVKVGFSENPERRMARLWSSGTRYGRPWDLSLDEPREMLLVIDGDKRVEWRCHTALSDYWAGGGEWYVDEPGVREFMESARFGEYPEMERPGGRFDPVTHEQMLPERRAELERMYARARVRARAG